MRQHSRQDTSRARIWGLLWMWHLRNCTGRRNRSIILWEKAKVLEKKSARTSEEMMEYYEKLILDYPIYSIEDPLDEEDWDGWSRLTARIGEKVQLVGDDLFVTNPERVAQGIVRKAANSRVDQGQSDRNADGGGKSNRVGAPGRVSNYYVPSFRGNRRYNDCRSGGGISHGADQDRGTVPVRTCGKIQCIASNRRQLVQNHALRTSHWREKIFPVCFL